jgi:hypothetical protein
MRSAKGEAVVWPNYFTFHRHFFALTQIKQVYKVNRCLKLFTTRNREIPPALAIT